MQAEYVFLTFENWVTNFLVLLSLVLLSHYNFEKNALFLQFHFRPILGHLKFFFSFFPQISTYKEKILFK